MAPEDDHGPVRCSRRHYGAPPALQRRPWRRRTVLACSNSSSNGVRHALDVDPGVPLLHVLRNELRLTRPKVGCGLEQCSPVPSSPATRCNAPCVAAARGFVDRPPAAGSRPPSRPGHLDPAERRPNVALFTGRVELGQSQVSAFARIGAEELDVGLARISARTGVTSHALDERISRALGVAVNDLLVDAGTVAAPDGRRVTYWGAPRRGAGSIARRRMRSCPGRFPSTASSGGRAPASTSPGWSLARRSSSATCRSRKCSTGA